MLPLPLTSSPDRNKDSSSNWYLIHSFLPPSKRWWLDIKPAFSLFFCQCSQLNSFYLTIFSKHTYHLWPLPHHCAPAPSNAYLVFLEDSLLFCFSGEPRVEPNPDWSVGKGNDMRGSKRSKWNCEPEAWTPEAETQVLLGISPEPLLSSFT